MFLLIHIDDSEQRGSFIHDQEEFYLEPMSERTGRSARGGHGGKDHDTDDSTDSAEVTDTPGNMTHVVTEVMRDDLSGAGYESSGYFFRKV